MAAFTGVDLEDSFVRGWQLSADSLVIAILALSVILGCATAGKQAYVVKFGVVELPEPRLRVVPEVLPVQQSRVISVEPMSSWTSSAQAQSPVRTIAVTIMPPRRWGYYTEQIIYYPPSPPKRIHDWGTGSATPPASVVTEGIDLGKREHRGPATIPAAFDDGDPVGTWRVEVFVNGEKQLDESFELVFR